MSKSYDKFVRHLFQDPYDAIRRFNAPTILIKITNLISKHVKIKKLIDIVKLAKLISEEVEIEKVPGYIKKRKVVDGIKKFCKEIGITLPKTLINFINELVAIYVSLKF